MCFDFLYNLFWHIAQSKKRWARYDKMHNGLDVMYVLFFQILIKLEIFSDVLKKYSNIKFYENPSNGSRFVLCGRTDGHKDSNNRFS
jgi:hypothetical protein